MLMLRLVLLLMLVSVGAYTAAVGIAHGWNLLPVFVGDILAVNWAGQFNLDFSCFLLLSALWIAWRHEFSASGLLLALCCSIGGILFMSVYLLIAGFRTDATMEDLLLGAPRAARLRSSGPQSRGTTP